MSRVLDRKGLIAKLDRLFSLKVRQGAANQGGWVDCVTCGKSMPWEDSDAGHFVRRGHMAVRWDTRNVHPQCTRCNRFLDGNEGQYALFIIDKYGEETLRELLALKKTTRKWSVPELKELLEQYQ
jgi:hypothetical protein